MPLHLKRPQPWNQDGRCDQNCNKFTETLAKPTTGVLRDLSGRENEYDGGGTCQPCAILTIVFFTCSGLFNASALYLQFFFSFLENYKIVLYYKSKILFLLQYILRN